MRGRAQCPPPHRLPPTPALRGSQAHATVLDVERENPHRDTRSRFGPGAPGRLVQQAVDAVADVDERAERNDADHRAVDDAAARVASDEFDPDGWFHAVLRAGHAITSSPCNLRLCGIGAGGGPRARAMIKR